MNPPVTIKKSSARTLIPRICNGLLWLVFCAMSGTGLLLAFRLPPGSRGGRGLSALGWDRHEWGDLHTGLSYAFLTLIVIHLALHWRWFWQIAGRRRAWPIVLGIGSGLLLLAGIVLLPVSKEEAPGRGIPAGGGASPENRQNQLRSRGRAQES
jgi:hypothetical protein